jgi:hypothetical protein
LPPCRCDHALTPFPVVHYRLAAAVPWFLPCAPSIGTGVPVGLPGSFYAYAEAAEDLLFQPTDHAERHYCAMGEV